MNKIIFLIIMLTVSFVTIAKAAQKERLIPRSMLGDKGTYYLVEMTKQRDIVRALSKRVGVSYVDYSLVEINCSTMMMRGLGESEASAEDIVKKQTKWFSLVPGSSKSDLANFVCNKK